MFAKDFVAVIAAVAFVLVCYCFLMVEVGGREGCLFAFVCSFCLFLS